MFVTSEVGGGQEGTMVGTKLPEQREQPPHCEEAGLPAFPGNRPFDLRQDS